MRLTLTARVLQAGCAARLVLVDGSPAYLSTHTTRGKNKRAARSQATDEADALAFFAQQFAADVDPLKVAAQLERLDSWAARVERTVQLAGGGAGHAAPELAAAAEAFYRKLVAADTYAPAGSLRAPVQLFTARDNYVTLGEDYGLRAVCAGPLRTRQLPATHRSILAGDAAAAIADHLSQLLAQ